MDIAYKVLSSKASAAAYIPLTFDPGEAYQFDWSHQIAVIDGATTTVKVVHVRQCHSRMLFVRVYANDVTLDFSRPGKLTNVGKACGLGVQCCRGEG